MLFIFVKKLPNSIMENLTAFSQQKNNETYTFASQPRAVQQRGKYRDSWAKTQCSVPMYANIMFDRRVVRGNTFTYSALPVTGLPDSISREPQFGKRRVMARKHAKEQLKLHSPEPVDDRRHIEVQTEHYLEEITDRVEEADVECQTDPFLDRPATPFFIPAKSGLDAETQIYEGDLFDFDLEVKPILEVLVGKTIEQALLEVMEEEELENIRSSQRAFLELRNAELLEEQRLEERERRHRNEKERRMKQHLEALEKEKETAEKIAAHAYTKSLFSDLVPATMDDLVDAGYFFDTIERNVEEDFFPWLMNKVENKVNKLILSRNILDELIKEVVHKRLDTYDKLSSMIQLQEDDQF